MKKGRIAKRVLVIVLLVSVLSAVSGCNSIQEPYSKTLVLTVDDSKVYLDEMMYHVMLANMQGELYASFVGEDKDYWEIKNEDGSTMREAMKDMALENAIRYEVFYELAMKDNYNLSKEQQIESEDKVENILSNVDKEELEKTELTKEKLIEIQSKIAVATQYYNDFLTKLNIDEDKIKSEIDPNQYKQYDIEYIYAGFDDYETLNNILEEAKKAKDITIVVEAKNEKLNVGKLSFLEGKDTFGEEVNLEDSIKEMAVGEEVFEEAYQSLLKEHKVTMEKKVWKQVKIG